jgi:hypothetical protein
MISKSKTGSKISDTVSNKLKYILVISTLNLVVFNCRGIEKEQNTVFESDNSALKNKMDSFFSLAQSGDIIFRNGIDEISRAARTLSRKDTSYSHCGIVLKEDSVLYVYHSIGGADNPSGKLQRIPIEEFCDVKINQAFALYRIKQIHEIESQLSKVVQTHYQNELKFDTYFNLASDDAMYCSEFVAKSLNQAFVRSNVRHSFIDLSGKGVTLDDIFLHPFCMIKGKIIF